MSTDCGTCVCRAPERSPSTGRLVLATGNDHTATALRSLALTRGVRLDVLDPGLLELCGEGFDDFLLAARAGRGRRGAVVRGRPGP